MTLWTGTGKQNCALQHFHGPSDIQSLCELIPKRLTWLFHQYHLTPWWCPVAPTCSCEQSGSFCRPLTLWLLSPCCPIPKVWGGWPMHEPSGSHLLWGSWEPCQSLQRFGQKQQRISPGPHYCPGQISFCLDTLASICAEPPPPSPPPRIPKLQKAFKMPSRPSLWLLSQKWVAIVF